jgi:hypothetical protein
MEKHGGDTSWKMAAWGVMLKKAMASLPDPDEVRIGYLVDTLERLYSYPAAATPRRRAEAAPGLAG